jgi:hypothetical protein
MIWYILNPPQDNKPLTPEYRRQLVGEEGKPSASNSARDGESVALWNPAWRVVAPDFEGTPRKLVEHAGRRNVLVTHPFDERKGASLERTIELPKEQPAELIFEVAAHERGDWELRIAINDQPVRKLTVTHDREPWQKVRVDLSAHAGQKINLRLENRANNWEWEFGYWADLQVRAGGASLAAQ